MRDLLYKMLVEPEKKGHLTTKDSITMIFFFFLSKGFC